MMAVTHLIVTYAMRKEDVPILTDIPTFVSAVPPHTFESGPGVKHLTIIIIMYFRTQ